MTRRAFVGIDCGTQSTKVLLMDAADETVLGVGRAHYDLIERPDGTREQQPEWWVTALVQAMREAHSAAGSVEVGGVGVSGQQHGLVCLGEGDRPLRPAKLWNDTTTVEECALLTEAVGGQDQAMALIGNSFLPGYTAPKVLWLRRHDPSVYADTRRMCLPHDYLNLWMTGSFATEPGDASGTAYFDVRQRQYSQPVLSAIDSARDWDSALPRIVPSLSVMGTLQAEAARALGLPPDVPVSAGGGDNMMAAIGVGAVQAGPVVVSLGTSGTVFAYRSQPAVDPRGEASAFCDSTGGWLPLVTTLNCTVPTDWVAGLFGMDHHGVERAMTESPAGANGLTFLPYLEGERTPNHPKGAGIFAGLRASHGPAHMVRAVVEGVTFGLKYAFGALQRSGVRATSLTLVGGAAASNAWAQAIADIFEVPVVRPPQVEAAAIGAARQVRWVVDGKAPVDAASGQRFEPAASSALREAEERNDRLRQVALESSL